MSKIENSVSQKLKSRAEIGLKKYGVTMDRKDLNELDWLRHAQEEAMDFILYITKIRRELAGKKFCECPNV